MKRKTLVYTVALLFSVMMLNACKSADVRASESEQNETVETKVKKTKKKEDPEKAARKERKARNAEIKKKSMELVCDKGIVSLKARPKLGSFSISVLNDKEKYIPVLATGNEYTSNAFYLKINKRIYKLVSDGTVVGSASELDDGLRLHYKIPNQAEVTVDMLCMKALPDSGDYDMVKVIASITNISEKINSYALKSVLDTVLGESGYHHFYTSEDIPIKAEVLYRTMKNEKWFLSKNENAVMQILLDGADITDPEMVVLGNYTTLNSKSWEPEVTNYKTFDTVLSYNNSAVGVLWPEVKLDQYETKKITFYLAFATDNHKVNGGKFIYGAGQEEEKKEVEEVRIPVPKAERKIVIPKVEQYQFPEYEEPDVNFNTTSLSKNQLTIEYVEALLHRIEALEDSGDAVNKTELLQLNEELDAILKVLRHN